MIYKLGGGWGDRIEFFSGWKSGSELQRVVGWKFRKPKINDELSVPMESGRTAIFKFVSAEHCPDPKDMFFADVEFVGYKED